MSEQPDWRKWFMHWLDRLMEPAVALSKAERVWVVNSRKWIMEKETRLPDLWARDKVRRIARREGLMQYGAQRQKARPGSAKRKAADWQHRPGAPMPVPPHRRRPTATI